jgi:hypothetical protein
MELSQDPEPYETAFFWRLRQPQVLSLASSTSGRTTTLRLVAYPATLLNGVNEYPVAEMCDGCGFLARTGELS